MESDWDMATNEPQADLFDALETEHGVTAKIIELALQGDLCLRQCRRIMGGTAPLTVRQANKLMRNLPADLVSDRARAIDRISDYIHAGTDRITHTIAADGAESRATVATAMRDLADFLEAQELHLRDRVLTLDEREAEKAFLRKSIRDLHTLYAITADQRTGHRLPALAHA